MSEELKQEIVAVRIFPTIGIARVGNSVDPTGWFYGPEVPGRFDVPPGGFKDAQGAVKRQVGPFLFYFGGRRLPRFLNSTLFFSHRPRVFVLMHLVPTVELFVKQTNLPALSSNGQFRS